MGKLTADRQGADLMRRGDIYLVAFGPSVEHEQRGMRPVLIVSPDAINKLTQVPVVLPITRGDDFARIAGFTVSLSDATDRSGNRCIRPRQSLPWT